MSKSNTTEPTTGQDGPAQPVATVAQAAAEQAAPEQTQERAAAEQTLEQALEQSITEQTAAPIRYVRCGRRVVRHWYVGGQWTVVCWRGTAFGAPGRRFGPGVYGRGRSVGAVRCVAVAGESRHPPRHAHFRWRIEDRCRRAGRGVRGSTGSDHGIRHCLGPADRGVARAGRLDRDYDTDHNDRGRYRPPDPGRAQLSMTFDGRGELTGVTFHGTRYRSIAPAELAHVLVETFREGRAQSMAKLNSFMGSSMLPNVDFTQQHDGAWGNDNRARISRVAMCRGRIKPRRIFRRRAQMIKPTM